MLAEGAYYLAQGLEFSGLVKAFLELEKGFLPFCEMCFRGEGAEDVGRKWRTVPYPSVSDEDLERLVAVLATWRRV
jgi:hypothetical protein